MNTASRSRALAITVALSALAACYSPSIPDGKLACSASGACPDNFSCASNGYCYQNGAAVPPDAPTGVSATPGVRSATITWTAPAKDGGSAITNYTVTAAPGGLSASSTTTTATLSGLDNAAAYTFTVVATNAIGNSIPSDPSASITTFGFPGAPTALVAAAATNGATLDWTAPADSGGTPVTGYLVKVAFNGGAYTQVSPSISGTHATITNLSGGGSYTFEVAAVNAVGAGDFSDPSSAIVLAAVPVTPTITAPATVSSGQTNVAASVVANIGETYAWTITGGTLTNTDGAAGEIANGTDSIAFTVTANPGGQVVLGCIATNPVGDSAPASFTAAVSTAPVQPTIVAALNVTIGDTGIVAQVAANQGMTYNWTLSSNATLASGDLHGTTAAGFNSITYNLGVNAQVGSQVFLSCVEVNASQQMSTAGTFAQTIVAAPNTPTITAPIMVAAGEMGASASVGDNAAMTYAWTLTGATFSSGSGAGGTVSGGIDSIQFDVTAAVGGSVVLSVIEINAANKQSAPATATVPVGSLPNPLSISVALDNGANPLQFQSGATQYATLGSTAVAQVAAVQGATYLWTISGGGAAATGETGTARNFSFTATNASQPILLGCTVALGSSNVVGSQTVTIVAAPVTPAISLDGQGSTGFIEFGDSTSHTAAVTSPVGTSTYAWSAAPSTDLLGLGASGTSVSFTLSSTAAAGDSIALHAVETNAAGRAGTAGTGTFTVLGELQQPVLSASAFAVAPARTYTSSAEPMQSGLTYHWAIAEVTDGVAGAAVACPSATPSACTVNADHSISFTVDSTIATDGHHALELQLTVDDQAGDTQTATPLDLDVIALPAVSILFGAPPSGDSFGANISVNGNREAFVANEADTTYLWSITPGSIESGGNTNDATFTGGSAVAGATLALSVFATNAAGSNTGDAIVTVVSAAGAPVVSVPAFANDPGNPLYTNQQYTATLTPGSPAGVSYRWTVANSGNTGCNAAGVLCGITPISGATPNSGSFSYTVTAAVGSTLSFSAVAIDAAGDPSGASNVAAQMVITPPTAPAIQTPFTSPGAPAGVTFTKLAPGAAYTLAVTDPVAGLHYVWTIGAQSCPAASFCTDASGNGSYSSIGLTANSSITSDQGNSPPHAGDTVTVTVAAVSSSGSTSSQPLVISVIAAPAAPSITVTDAARPNGINPATGQLTPNSSDGAFVDSAASLSYFWTATNAGSASVLTSSASGTAGTIGSQPINQITFTAPPYHSGEAVTFGVTTYNAAAYASAIPVTIAVNGSTPATVNIPALAADLRSPHALTFGAQHIEVDVTPNSGDSFNCYPLDGNTTVENPNDSGLNGSTSSPFFIDISATPTVDGSQWDSSIECDELVTATGATLSATKMFMLAPPLTVVSITPANGSSDVDVTTNPTILFSYPPDPSTLHIDGSCAGSVSIFNSSDMTCPGFTFQQDSINKALFTAEHTTPFESGATYVITVQTNATGPVADLQGVPLGQGLASTFATHVVPAIDSGTVVVTPHLQSLDLSWTNPSDAARDHVAISASWNDTDGAPHTASVSTGSAAASTATISGIDPEVAVNVTFQSCDNAGCTVASSISMVSTATAFSGAEVDFSSSQTVTGLGPSFNGSGGAKFSAIWDSLSIYFGFEQADGAANALRNDGDSLWIAIDIDGSGNAGNGTLRDVNGESFTTTGNTAAGGSTTRIIWPFRADYVVELKNSAGTLVANLRTVSSNSWAAISAPVDFNGTLAELMVTPQELGGDVHYNLRFAMAFWNLPSGLGVIDLAPAGFSNTSTDGHTPATDVLGNLASITNAFDPQGSAFRFGFSGNPHLPAFAAHLTPAMSLVTMTVDTTGQGFSGGMMLNGNLPPFSYVAADSNYQLADDATRGDVSASDNIYSGVFNLGIFDATSAAGSLPLFFEFTHDAAAEGVFNTNHNDRVWALSGGNDSVGGNGGISYGVVYDLTHGFELDFDVNNIIPTSDTAFVVLGDQPEIGDWSSTPFAANDPLGTGGAPLNVPASSSSGTAAVTFLSGHDFASGGSNCINHGDAADPTGCPLNWKAVGQNGGGNDYENPSGGNDSMNDDVINKRVLTWNWGSQPSF